MTAIPRYPFIVQGHRGVRLLDDSGAVENTPAAFAEAFKAGAEIELDLQMTADREFIVYHDPVLRAKDITGLDKDTPVFHLSLAEVQKLRFKSSHPPLLSIDQVIAKLLEEFDTHYKIDFELKYEGVLENKVPAEEFTAAAVRKIQKLWPTGSFRVRSFSPEVVLAIKKFAPELETAMLTWTVRPDYLALLKLTQADILAPHLNFISLEEVKAVQAAGHPVIPYAVQGHGELDIHESPELYRHLFEHFDGWTSDSPKLVFAEAKKLGVPVIKY